MAAVTTVPPAATPERLTELLRRAGALPRGRVVDVTIETSRETLISSTTRLRLSYDGGGGPTHVFFKSHRVGSDPRWHEFGDKEVNF